MTPPPPPPASGRLLRLLDHPRLVPVAAAFAALAGAPALGSGLIADDWFFRAHLDPRSTLPPGRGPLLELFAFFPRDSVTLLAWRDAGILPWWAQADLRGAFFRPLAALTHMADYALAPDAPWVAHLQNLGWAALAVLAAGALYREWVGGRAAALATVLFALDDTHAISTAWIADRNGAMAVTFGALAGVAFLRGARVLGPLAFLAALLSAEAGTATAALLLVLSGRRRRALVPYVLVGAAWAAAWVLGGYGIHGSALYLDPLRAPVAFLAHLPERLGALNGTLWLNLPVDFWAALPTGVALGIGLGMAALSLLFVGAVAGDTLRRDPRARAALLFALLALVPSAAGFPMGRLAAFAGLGAFALLGLVLAPALEAGLPRRRDRFALVWHGPVAGLGLVGLCIGAPAFLGQLAGVVDAVPDGPALATQDVVIVGGLEVATAYIPIARQLRGQSVPHAMLVLSPAATPVRVTREDAHTLRIDAPGGLFGHAVERLCRDAPFVAGEAVTTTVGTVTVLTVDHGRPTSLRAVLPYPLDSARYTWLAPTDGALAPWSPPPLGEAVDVPALLPIPG